MGRGDGSSEKSPEQLVSRQDAKAKRENNKRVKESLSSLDDLGVKVMLGHLFDDNSGKSKSIQYSDLRVMIRNSMSGFSEARVREVTDKSLDQLRDNGIVYKPKRGIMEWTLTPEAENILQSEKDLLASIKNTGNSTSSSPARDWKEIFTDYASDSFHLGYENGERVFLTDQNDDHNSEIFQKIAERRGQPFTEINLAERMSGPEIDFENLTADEWPEQKGGLPANLERLRSSLQKPGIVYVNSKNLGSDLSLGAELPDALVQNLARELSSPSIEVGKKTLAIGGKNITVHKDCSVIIGYNENSDDSFGLFERLRIL
jgi:hypothetical protein